MARDAALVVCTNLMWQEPDLALQFAVERGVENPGEVLETAVSAWVKKDQSAALRWAQDLEQGLDRGVILARVIDTIAAGQPQLALDIFRAEAESGRDVTRAANSIARPLVKNGTVKDLSTFCTTRDGAGRP